MRRLSAIIAIAIVVAACGGGRRDHEVAQFRHDGPIVLITIDTLRSDRVGAYGSTRRLTPNIDALVERSGRAFVFRNAAAQVPLTLPSHATILTGLHPQAHGVRTNDGGRLGADRRTIAEALHDIGYATGAFVGGYPVSAASGLARGFDRYDDDFLKSGANERRADEVVAPALRWIRQRPSARFFVWVHLFDPHSPYEAPAEYAAAHPNDPYDAEVAYADAALGRFFDGLRAGGLLDRSLIVIVADHGESLGEHGERTHGTFLYDATIHVPMLVIPPADNERRSAGQRSVADPVETADLAPTIAAMAGATMGGRLDGIDLRAAMQRSTTPAAAAGAGHPTAYAETYYQNVLLGWSPLRALRGPDWKYIEAPKPELYDLQQDPGELHNAIAARAGVARALASAMPAAVSNAAAPNTGGESAERLRSLGYVAGRTESAASTGADPKDKIAVWNAIEEGIDASSRDPARAEAAFDRAARLDPGNGLVMKYIADLRFRAGRLRDAADGYRRAIAAGFRHPDAYVNLGAIAERGGRLDEAAKSFSAAAALAPEDGDAWNRLGMIEFRRGDVEGARHAFTSAVHVAPERPESHYNLALVERRAGDEGAAEEHLRQAVALNPRYAEAQYALATGYLASHRAERALETYRAALAAKPDYPEALFGAARAALDLGRADEARRSYERFIAIAPPAYAPQIAAARDALRRLRQ